MGQGATSGGQAIPGQTPGVAPASPVPPAGPISRVAAAAPDLTPVPEAPPPTALFPDQKPGNAVQLLDPETGVIHDAAFLGETPEGVSVRINGTPITLTPEEFDQARNGAAKVEAEAKAAPKKAQAKQKKPIVGQGGQVEVPNVGLSGASGAGENGNGGPKARQEDSQVPQGKGEANSDQQQPALAGPAQGSPSATGPGELSPALTRPSAAPMAAPSERVQPDMLGGEAKTEAQLAAKERTKREWGRFLGMAEGAKGASETELDGRTVLIRPGKVVIRARVDGASDLDFRIDTEGMSRDQIAAATRGALSELDRRAPINRKAEEYKPAPARAPEAAPIPGATPADDVAADPAKPLPDMPPGMETPVSQVSQVSRPEAPGKAEAPKADEPEAAKPAAGLLGALSQEKQDRAAELKARLAAKARTQLSSGLDPEYITLGGELVALYIEAGTKRFGQMLRDFAESTGLTLRQAQAPMRAAYNHVRDTMDLDGQDVSDMDDGAAVTADPVPVTAMKDLAAAVQAEVARSGLAGKVTPKVVRGLLNAAGVPIQGRQAGATIEVNPAAADPVGVARHEIIHALRDPKLWDSEFGLFTRAEWLGLVKDARSDTTLVKRIAEQYSDRPTSVQTEEAVAKTYRL